MRTDLPIEGCLDAAEELTGAEWEQEKQEDEITVSTVRIKTKEGEQRLKRPKGLYITLECPHIRENRLDIHERIMDGLVEIWKKFLKPIENKEKILIIGLGNREIIADALGPRVVEQILVTRHIRGRMPEDWKAKLAEVSALAPGVMGQTGIETGEIVECIVKTVKPEVVIAVDALAAGALERLVNTIQICNTGIQPGAGMGNRRKELSRKTLGIPVIAVGIPTVMDIGSMAEKEGEETFFATPKDMDVVLERVSRMIACSLNRALHQLSEEELEAYLY